MWNFDTSFVDASYAYPRSSTVFVVNESRAYVITNNGLIVRYESSWATLSSSEHALVIPTDYAIIQNYPNPFNPITTINYQLPIGNSQLTVIRIYDVLGREAATLVNEVKQPGTYAVQWDAANQPSGIYFYRLKSGNNVQTKKMVLMK